uniref:Uncharacterized protein n=1 Tax=Arundo donax TaxID=35708 RepID=A0A0A9F608_ARUDO
MRKTYQVRYLLQSQEQQGQQSKNLFDSTSIFGTKKQTRLLSSAVVLGGEISSHQDAIRIDR